MESPFTHNTIASGNDFLSRKREVSQTVLNIRNRINTVIYEPPKTGKDSLVHMAISQCPGLSTAYIDLLSIVDNGDLSHRLQAADGHTLIYIKNFQSILRLDDWSKAVHAISRQMLRDDAPVYIITGSGINAMKHIFEDHKLMYRQYERIRFSAIDERSVTEHIVRTFLKVGRVVSQEQAEYIYNIADGHPWYIWQIADYCFNITKGYLSGNAVTEAKRFLEAENAEYSTLSYNILEGRTINTKMMQMMDTVRRHVVFVASNSEAFVNDVVRNLHLCRNMERDITLIGLSKWKSFETIDVEDFHEMNLNLSLPFHVDYSSGQVKDFLLRYRALFNVEPTPYSFQGYDLTAYFAEELARYGRHFMDRDSFPKKSLMQTALEFHRIPGGGFENRATKEIVYKKDYTITHIFGINVHNWYSLLYQ